MSATTERSTPIPYQQYCWACDAAFETTDPRQRNCDRCIAHYAAQRDNPWYRDPAIAAALDAPPTDYLADLAARTDALMAVALAPDAPGVRFPDRAAALEYLGQDGDVEIDQQAIDEYFAHMERTDPFMQPED